MEPAHADDRIWIRYSRERAFPISAVSSIALHGIFLTLALVGVMSLFSRPKPVVMELEPIVIGESAGGGNRGQDDGTRAGPTTGADSVDAIEHQRRPSSDLLTQTLPTLQRPPADPPPPPEEIDPRSPLERRLANLPALPSLQPLLKGLPDGTPAKGTAGRGTGQGPGTGAGIGPGDGSAGRLTQKQKRQLRWTLSFSIKSSTDYLDQLNRLKAIIGVQYPDKSIKLVTNLSRRPVKLEAGDRVPDRIFWMDDNPEAVRSISRELGIDPLPWRVIAFFPASLEEELLRKEKAYGKHFGRETEDDIQETVFRVDGQFGVMEITVTRQTGR